MGWFDRASGIFKKQNISDLTPQEQRKLLKKLKTKNPDEYKKLKDAHSKKAARKSVLEFLCSDKLSVPKTNLEKFQSLSFQKRKKKLAQMSPSEYFKLKKELASRALLKRLPQGRTSPENSSPRVTDYVLNGPIGGSEDISQLSRREKYYRKLQLWSVEKAAFRTGSPELRRELFGELNTKNPDKYEKTKQALKSNIATTRAFSNIMTVRNPIHSQYPVFYAKDKASLLNNPIFRKLVYDKQASLEIKKSDNGYYATLMDSEAYKKHLMRSWWLDDYIYNGKIIRTSLGYTLAPIRITLGSIGDTIQFVATKPTRKLIDVTVDNTFVELSRYLKRKDKFLEASYIKFAGEEVREVFNTLPDIVDATFNVQETIIGGLTALSQLDTLIGSQWKRAKHIYDKCDLDEAAKMTMDYSILLGTSYLVAKRLHNIAELTKLERDLKTIYRNISKKKNKTRKKIREVNKELEEVTSKEIKLQEVGAGGSVRRKVSVRREKLRKKKKALKNDVNHYVETKSNRVKKIKGKIVTLRRESITTPRSTKKNLRRAYRSYSEELKKRIEAGEKLKLMVDYVKREPFLLRNIKIMEGLIKNIKRTYGEYRNALNSSDDILKQSVKKIQEFLIDNEVFVPSGGITNKKKQIKFEEPNKPH